MTAQLAHDRLLERLRHCLGPRTMAALTDDETTELVLNPDGQLFVERLGGGFIALGSLSSQAAETLIGLVAHAGDTVVDRRRPIVSGLLPLGNWRFEGLMPPVVTRPSFAIRKPAIRSMSLTDYLNSGAIGPKRAAALRQAIEDRQNIVVAGGTSSGKTTLADALLNEIAALSPEHRLVVLEDTAELRSAVSNQVALRTSDEVGMVQLLRSALRLRPDRIIVGEVRDGAALTLLKAWNTGHTGGVATVHANSASAALLRLEQLVGEVSASPMQAIIAEAVDLVVSIRRTATGRRIEEVIRVLGVDAGGYQLEPIAPEECPNAA